MGGAGWDDSLKNRVAHSEACLRLCFDAVLAASDYTLASKGYKPRVLAEGGFIDECGGAMEARERTKTETDTTRLKPDELVHKALLDSHN